MKIIIDISETPQGHISLSWNQQKDQATIREVEVGNLISEAIASALTAINKFGGGLGVINLRNRS